MQFEPNTLIIIRSWEDPKISNNCECRDKIKNKRSCAMNNFQEDHLNCHSSSFIIYLLQQFSDGLRG